MENVSYADAEKKMKEEHPDEDWNTYVPEGAETIDQVTNRMVKFLTVRFFLNVFIDFLYQI